MAILQARIPEWVAMLSSRGSSEPGDWTQVAHTADGFFTSWATREPKNTGAGSLPLLQGDVPNPGTARGSPALQEDSLPAELPGEPLEKCNSNFNLETEITEMTYLPLKFPLTLENGFLTAISTIYYSSLWILPHSTTVLRAERLKENLGNDNTKHSNSPSLTSKKNMKLAHTKQSIIRSWDLKLQLLKASPLIIVITFFEKGSRKAYCFKKCVVSFRLKQIQSIKQITVKHSSIFFNSML